MTWKEKIGNAVAISILISLFVIIGFFWLIDIILPAIEYSPTLFESFKTNYDSMGRSLLKFMADYWILYFVSCLLLGSAVILQEFSERRKVDV